MHRLFFLGENLLFDILIVQGFCRFGQVCPCDVVLQLA